MQTRAMQFPAMFAAGAFVDLSAAWLCGHGGRNPVQRRRYAGASDRRRALARGTGIRFRILPPETSNEDGYDK